MPPYGQFLLQFDAILTVLFYRSRTLAAVTFLPEVALNAPNYSITVTKLRRESPYITEKLLVEVALTFVSFT